MLEIRKGLISKYLTYLEFSKNNIKQYYLTELTHLSIGTQLNHLMSISKLFESNDQRIKRNKLEYNKKILKHVDISLLTENDIMDLLEGEWYKSLKPQVQKLKILRIKAYLKFSKRHDLVEILPKKFKSRRSMHNHRRYHNDEFRENIRKSQKEANNRPEVKEKRSKASKEVWNRPGFRDKMSKLREGENNSMYNVHRYGEENPNWKGNKAGYQAIHKRVGKRKIKPDKCEICNKPEFYENLGRLELSDKTGLCLDDPNNFQYIHHSCHKKYDNRNNIFHIKLPFY